MLSRITTPHADDSVRGFARARRLLAGSSLWLVGLAVVVATLPGPAAVAAPAPAPAPAAAPEPTQCFLGDTGLACPTVPGPASLVPPATLTGMPPAAREALTAFSDQAVTSVIARYGLDESDRPAVLSYGRYDALAELWGLVVQSFETPKAQRTARQRAVVDWLGGRVRSLRSVAPPYAAIEYAKFAGKNVNQLEQLLYFGGTEQQIKDFLTGTPEPFDRPDTANATGGYCRYRPPAPYSAEFDGRNLQSCFTPCQNIFGCAPTTPDYASFVKWGNAKVGDVFDSQTVASQSALIAGATVAGGAVAGQAAGAALISMGSTIFPFATATGALTVFSVAAIFAVPAVVLAAVAIAAVAGINVASIEEMPGKLASAIAQSRQPVDADTLWATTDGKATLYSLFVDSVSPAPRSDITCDNSRVEEIWQSWSDGVPVRAFAWEVDDFNIRPCLNAPPVPEATPYDPFFKVTKQGSGTTTEETSIAVAHPDPATVTTLRTGGDNWFVAQSEGQGEKLALHVNLTDWQGRTNTVWLERTPQGYTFHGIRAAADGSFDVDPDNCTTCWESDRLEYVGPDGVKRTARIGLYQAPTGTPSYTTGTLFINTPITFNANDFAPGGAVGNVTYTWRFQKDTCGDFGCFTLDPETFDTRPVYGDPVAGPVATHAWNVVGGYYARVEATDSAGHTAAREFIVRVRTVAPKLTLSIDCALAPVPVSCNNYPTTAGSESILFGGARRNGDRDAIEMRIDWGDGTGDYQVAGQGLTVDPSPIRLTAQSDGRLFLLNARHTYAQPGYYNVTVAAKNQFGDSETKTTVLTIRGKQQVTLPQPSDKVYGDAVVLDATGSASGAPVTFTAGPADVCRTDVANPARVLTVGVGTCDVTARQAATGDIWLASDVVSRSFDVAPAPLTVKADDKTATYGGALPALTATVTGLRNGDTRADLGELVLTGPAAGSRAGSYDIVPSGVSDPNYDISFVDGTLTIGRAPLTITPGNRTRVYGAPQPTHTATFDGLVNGDTPADITGLTIAGPAKAAHVGSYDIVAAGADNTDYAYTYKTGTETITPAPLTISADDKTRRYGAASPTYTSTFDGLVNSDGPGSVGTLTYGGAAPGADVGEHPITVSGATNPDYDITLVAGTETVTPAPLTITAEDKTRRYGAPSPAYTSVWDGLINGDDRSDVPGLTLTGPPASAGAGTYPITPRGAANPNYDIDFVDGEETVTRAPLTVTADDQSRVYGTPRPTYTARADGLVNGDPSTLLGGLAYDAAPQRSGVGTYPIVPRGLSLSDYDVQYVAGTERITRARLTIHALDATVRSGARGAYGWTGRGWVNGDGDSTIGTRPTCSATEGAPGRYAGAITCAGAADPNYAIDYAAGTLTVNPLLRLNQTGLPSRLPRRVVLDGQPLPLPFGDVEVAFGSAHAFAFPSVVVGERGATYMTRTPAFSGPVAGDISVTARYVTMRDVLKEESARGGLSRKDARALRKLWWTGVRRGLSKGDADKANAAVKEFAKEVRDRTGKGVDKDAARTLRAYARLVKDGIATLI